MAQPISIIITCCNNEQTIEAACASCTWADEIVVVDSGSTDRTVEIARRFTDRVIIEPWRGGYSKQKEFATSQARNDWVFIVDSDEEVSPELAAEVQSWDQAYFDRWDIIHVPRKNWVLGRFVRAWLPDYGSRIFHRDRVRWNEHVLHDAREPLDPSRVTHSRCHLLHKRIGRQEFEGYFSGKRMDARVMPVARQMYDRGRRCHWWDLLFRPWGAFFKFYIMKRGFLDGTFGLMMAQKASVSVQLKYAALWAIQNDPELAGDDQFDAS